LKQLKSPLVFPQIKEEYYNILPRLKNLRDQRKIYLSGNKLLINKNLVLQDDLILIQNKIKEHITGALLS
jgi:hypothetical protein